MLEVLDTLLGPLFRINPVKYAFNKSYRISQQNKLGKEAKYTFRYQMIFAIACIFLLFLILWS